MEAAARRVAAETLSAEGATSVSPSPRVVGMSLRSSVARAIEQGALPSALTAAPARLYAMLAQTRIARPLILPPAVPVVGIGGAVLGGAGKTPVAIAYARALCSAGARVTLVAHGYGASPTCVVSVRPGHALSMVGDDALAMAQDLRNTEIAVLAGSTRQQAIDAAASSADVVVVDGLLQTKPRRLARSVLVLDAQDPWGAGHCPPAGDLRAPTRELLAACDEVVLVRDPAVTKTPSRLLAELGKAVRQCLVRIDGVRLDAGERLALAEVARMRVGLLLTVARPSRVLASLRARQLHPCCLWFGADHRGLSGSEGRTVRALARDHRIGLWLVTQKCRPHLSSGQCGAPLGTLQTSTWLDPMPRTVLDSLACVGPLFC
jgi:tetraacyldisaccharide 4'-kinase